MYSAPGIRPSPEFDKAMAKISSEPNPEVALLVMTAAVDALLRQCPKATKLETEFISSLEDVDPTSERSIYNHYGFVRVVVSAETPEGQMIELNGQYDTQASKLAYFDLKQ